MAANDPGESGAHPSGGGPEAQSLINIEVAFATPNRQRIVRLQVAPGTTVSQAIEASGLAREFPEVAMRPAVGIFSHKVTEDQVLEEGDRVEIYRPLLIDPKEARRLRADKEGAKKEGKKRR